MTLLFPHHEAATGKQRPAGLEAQGKVYKDGLLRLAPPYDRTRLRRLALSPEEAITLYLAGRGMH